ncbi:MAG: AroM family protein [Vicinamibacterales bacterium]
MTRVGILTIGQSPRTDVVPVLREAFGAHVPLVEAGALDGLTRDDLEARPDRLDGERLVTRLADGTEIHVGASFVHPLVESALHSLATRADVVLMLCTGTFPAFRCARPVLYPSRVLAGLVSAIQPTHLGVMTPDVAQLAHQEARWRSVVPRTTVVAASPYGSEAAVRAAAGRLSSAGADLVVLDCIGFGQAMRDVVGDMTPAPILVASRCLARVASELLR